MKPRNACEWHQLTVLFTVPHSNLGVTAFCDCSHELSGGKKIPQIRTNDSGLFFGDTSIGHKTRAGLSPQEQEHQHLGKDPTAWGRVAFPKIFAGNVQDHSQHTQSSYSFPSWAKRDIHLESTLNTGLLHPLSKATVPENILENDHFLLSLLPFVSSAACVERIPFWSPWTCLSSGDHLQLEIVLSSMPLSTIHFRPGKACLVLLGCYKWIQTCT